MDSLLYHTLKRGNGLHRRHNGRRFPSDESQVVVFFSKPSGLRVTKEGTSSIQLSGNQQRLPCRFPAFELPVRFGGVTQRECLFDPQLQLARLGRVETIARAP